MRLLDNLYIKACHAAGTVLKSTRHEKYVSEELRENLELSRFDVKAEEVVALTIISTLFCGLLVVATILFLGVSHLSLVLLPLPLLTYLLAGWYPKWRAEGERVRALGEVPTLVAYLTIGMKVAPNLERATNFAAENVHGHLGRSLREILAHTTLRVYTGIDEALTKFSQRWGKWCEELKRSIYLVKSSVNERNESSRMEMLDRALESALEGSRNRMQRFIAWLHTPTLILYSIGVLLPLVLIAVLPVLSVINISFGITQVFFVYCVLLPVVVYSLSRYMLSKRQDVFPPLEVPIANTNRTRATILSFSLAAAFVFVGLLFSNDEVLCFTVLWGATLGIVLYLHLTYMGAFEQRNRIERMESELCDSLVQLGNRISEGRPAEDAFEKVAGTMCGSELSGVLARISANIKFGGVGLRSAIFDPERGALREFYSKTAHSVFRLLVDIIERSTLVAGATILAIAEHLQELKRVQFEIKRLLGEVVASMRSVALFFAPLIAAVVARMQNVLAFKGVVGFLQSSTSVQPVAFLFVVGIYVLIFTAILISYATEIEFGNDKLVKRVAIARALPVSLAVFTISAIFSGQLMNAIVG